MGEFGRDFFLDPGISIKQEPLNESSSVNMSASVPIPPRRELTDYRDDFENSQSPLYADLGFTAQLQTPGIYDVNCWGLNRLINNDEMLKCESFIHMDDDDIFQVDKADLIQGPTLAELNANDDNLLGDLNFDDLLLPEESTYIILEKGNPQTPERHLANNCASPFLLQNNLLQKEIDSPSSVPTGSFDYYKYRTPASAFSPESRTSSNSSIVQSISSPSNVPAFPQRHSALHDLLVQRDQYDSPDKSMLGQSFPERHTGRALKLGRTHGSRLSSSAPTHSGLDQIWQRREPRKHLLSTSSLAECGSTSSISTGGLLSPDPPDFSLDDEDSDEDSDAHYEDFSSDNVDSDDEEDKQNKHGTSRKDRYFWQYNIQAKGPKGQRLIMKSKMEDPHHLNRVTDPVFSPDCSLRGIKHSGKARKGDGNDLTPNSKKLYNIGRELDKLARIINDMTPVSELPFNVRPTSRKEKNKLASRACRLKKKAQHEANKIKLNGLEFEHRRFLNAIVQGKQILNSKLAESSRERQEDLTVSLEKILKTCAKIRIAGHTTEYVNKVLDKLKGGATVRIDDDS